MERMNEPSVDGGTVTARPRRGKVLPAVALIVFVAVMAILLRHKTTPPPAILFMPMTNAFANVTLPIPDRWIPRTWGWLWRTKSFLFGQPRSVMLEGTVLRLDFVPMERQETWFPKPEKQAETNELRLCILGESELRDLRQRVRTVPELITVAAPQMTTADGMQGQMSTTHTINTPAGPRTAGVQIGFFPRRRDHATDLTASVLITRAVP